MMGGRYGARFFLASTSSSPDGYYLVQRKLVDALDFRTRRGQPLKD